MTSSANTPSRPLLLLAALALVVLGALGGWFIESSRKARIEGLVHDYLLAHPEVLPEAMERLRQNETEKQLAAVSGRVFNPFPGAVLGNPQGKVTLVEFTDFACTYCRASVAEVDALIAANPDLRVVVRELPILSPQSADAARMGLAAAEQGRYAAFHHAMFAAGAVTPATIEAAARSAGVDMERARKLMADPRLNAELTSNVDVARKLGFEGTPSWVIGKQVFNGAVGREKLAEAIAAARQS